MKLIKVFVSFVMISLFVGLGNAFNSNMIPEVEGSDYDKSTDVVETIKIPDLELDDNEDKQIVDEKAIDNSFSESKKETSTTSKNDNQNETKKESTSKKK